jgi:hypothetical protein
MMTFPTYGKIKFMFQTTNQKKVVGHLDHLEFQTQPGPPPASHKIHLSGALLMFQGLNRRHAIISPGMIIGGIHFRNRIIN